MRRVLVVIFLILAGVPTWSGRERLPLFGARPVLRAERIALYPDSPARRDLGALEYLGGLRLRGNDPAFGGFSAMTVAGDRFTLLADGSTFIRFRMGSDLRPHSARFGVLSQGPGTGWPKESRDSEAMARDPATGTAWVAFERTNQIWRYEGQLARATGQVIPALMRPWSTNGGPESMARLRDGRFIVIAENTRWPEDRARGPGIERAAILFNGDPVAPGTRADRWRYRPPAGFSPTDATELPDGRIAILNRRVGAPDFFTAVLTVIDGSALRPGATLTGRIIARFEPPVRHENFEAIAATREGDATILWIASDDNQSWLQQTLLLKFRLVD